MLNQNFKKSYTIAERKSFGLNKKQPLSPNNESNQAIIPYQHKQAKTYSNTNVLNLKKQRLSVLRAQIRKQQSKLKIQSLLKAIFNVMIFLSIARGSAKITRLMNFGAKNSKRPKMILYPSDYLKKVFDVILIFVLVFCSTYIPYRTAFIQSQHFTILIIDYTLDAFFLVDFIFIFRTAFYNNNNEFINDSWLIARHYITGWFIVDFLALLPIQYLILQNNNNIIFSDFFVFNKILRLLRIFRIKDIFNEATLNHNKVIEWAIDLLDIKKAKLFKIIVVVLFGSHVFACFWYLSAQTVDYDSDWREGKIENNLSSYVTSYYWSIQTLTAVGYGDTPAKNEFEYCIAIIWIIIGAIYQGVVIGNLSEQLKDLEQNSYQLQLLEEYHTLFKATNVLPEFQKQAFNYLRFNNNNNAIWAIGQQEWFTLLPLDYQKLITLWLSYKQMMQIHFFRLNLNFAVLINPMIIIQKTPKSELIWMKDDQVDEIHFLLTGLVQYKTQFAQTILDIKQGGVFGEQEFFNKRQYRPQKTRLHYALAAEDCVYLTISSEYFFEQLSCYRSLLQYFALTADLREGLIRENIENIRLGQAKEREKSWKLEQIKSACKIELIHSKGMLKNVKSEIYDTRLSKTAYVLDQLIKNKQNTISSLFHRFRKVVRMIIFANRTIDKQIFSEQILSSKQSLSTTTRLMSSSARIFPLLQKIKQKAKKIRLNISSKQKLKQVKFNTFKSYYETQLGISSAATLPSSIFSSFKNTKSKFYCEKPDKYLDQQIEQLKQCQKQISLSKWLIKLHGEDIEKEIEHLNKIIQKL